MWLHVEQSMLFYSFSKPKFSSSQFAKDKSGVKEGTYFSKVKTISPVKWKFHRFFSPFPHEEDQYNQALMKKYKDIVGFFLTFRTGLNFHVRTWSGTCDVFHLTPFPPPFF